MAVVFLIGCDHSDPPARDGRDLCFGDGRCAAEIHQNEALQLVTHDGQVFLDIVGGDKMVFEYRFEPNVPRGIQDGPGPQYIYVQVDANAGSFDYDTVPAETAYYRVICGECQGPFGREIKRGTLKGTKLSATQWSIKANFFLEQGDQLSDREVIVDAVFTKQ